MNTQKHADYSQSQLGKQIATLAFPAIVEMILHMMVGMVDTAMVGRLGAPALASVGLANQIFGFGTTFFGGLATGCTALVARSVGAKDSKAAGKVAKQSLQFGIILSAFTMLLLLVGGEAFMRLAFPQMEELVINLGTDYVKIVSSTLVFHFTLILVNAVLRGAGDTKTPMLITAVVNVLNIAGNYLLIFGAGPIPAFGVQGAALATALAQVVGALIALVALVRMPQIKISLRGPYRFEREILKRIFNTGLPIAIEHGSTRFMQLLFTMLITSLGTLSYAAFQVATQAESLSFMPSFGFSLAAMTLVGQNIGAKQLDLAEKSAKLAEKIVLIVNFTLAFVFLLFAEHLVGIFTNDPQVIKLAALGLRIVAVAQPPLGSGGVLSSGLRAAGDNKWVLYITTTSFIVIRLGLAYFLTITLNLGLVGAWSAMTIDTFVRWALIRRRFNQNNWKTLEL